VSVDDKDENARLIVVGGGHMGFAIVRGLLGGPLDRELVVVDVSTERRQTLAHHAGFSVTSDLRVRDGDFVVLAIPPQAFRTFAAAQGHQFSAQAPVLSVMAGITAAAIAEALGTTQVVRAIPNTPSEVFAGMSVYFAPPQVGPHTVAVAEHLLTAVGRALRVDSEDLVDDATAICGGGPAFVSYIVDAFCQFAAGRGFSAEASREMAVQVFGGTATLIAESGKPPMQLCREVMTPNGTTERGIAALGAGDVRSAVMAALDASARRSRELAGAADPSWPGPDHA
jgi:pyrroline-5-carboxylate reductase